ncbi:hypothetical protein [Rhizobium miluonense]|uniref:YXWGXW repeat-containing protein n=1 Tax=Rhizobium miluonense TaxID=411945 RepID=A0A1C3ULV9_9HYPH|nr:hypothetical protein [Rhizobium miluonense]SCB16455.1 hypothetical protein GA0061102_1004175 [Rhizobium miluonense]
MKYLASIALTAALTVGSVLSVALPTTAAPLGVSPATTANVILVQEQGSRWHPDSDYDRRAYWRDRERRHWRDDRDWDRRHWDRGWHRGWYDEGRYHHPHHGGVILEIRP